MVISAIFLFSALYGGNTRTSRINTWMKMTGLCRHSPLREMLWEAYPLSFVTLFAIMEGLQPWCSAALPIIARCCKSCSCEKSPFLYCCWWGHSTPFTSWLGHGFMEFNAAAVHLLTPEVPVCFFLHMCSVCSSRAWRVEGKAQGFFSWSYSEDRPQEFKFLPHILFIPCTAWCGLKCQCEGWCCWARVTVTGAVLCLWETLPEQMEYCRSRQWGRGSTAGDICRESPGLLGGGCGSLEAIVANTVDAPQGQLRLCKWLCSVVILCHFNCISNLKWQLCRGKVGCTNFLGSA